MALYRQMFFLPPNRQVSALKATALALTIGLCLSCCRRHEAPCCHYASFTMPTLLLVLLMIIIVVCRRLCYCTFLSHLVLKYTLTHPFNCSFSGTTQVSRYQKGKTNLDFTEARDSEWQWHQLGHMQVNTLLQTDNDISTPPLSFLQAGCPSCHPTNSVKALKEYSQIYNIEYYCDHCFNSRFLGELGLGGFSVWYYSICSRRIPLGLRDRVAQAFMGWIPFLTLK